MQKLTYINSNKEYIDLTSSPFGITEWEGFSNVEMEIQSQSVPFVDGSVYIDNLLSDRELTVTLAIEDNGNLFRRYELRREIIKILNPKLGEGFLIYKNNYLEKQIRCIPHTPIFENHNSNDSGTVKASLTFTACEPYWEDLDTTLVNFSLTEQPTVINKGDCSTQVKLKISGQSTNVRITNVTTGSQIGITGTITEPVDICTEFGKKSITGSVMGWTNIFGGTLKGIANKGDIGVIVGTDGSVLMSKNGINWKSQISQTIENLNSVTANFNFNLFVAVGDSGTIIYSENGTEWQNGTSSVTSEINSIACSDLKFVAVGDSGTILTSSDGINFSSSSSPTDNDLNCIIYDGVNFIAVGDSGTILTSSDGLSWSVKSSGTFYTINSIAYNVNSGEYIAVGNEGLMLKSNDLTNWTILPPLLYNTLNSISYNEYTEEFVIVGNQGILISGKNEFKIKDNIDYKNLRIIYFSKEFGLMFIGGEGILLRGANVDEWVKALNITDSQLHDVIYIPDLKKYISSGINGQMVISDDGEIWNSISIHLNVNIYKIIYNSVDKIIIGVGTGGSIIRSRDGIQWEIVVDGIEPYKYLLKIDDESYLLINDDDNDKLIIATSEGTNSLRSICFIENKHLYIAVGDNGRITTSYDGSNWVEQASNVTENLNAVIEKDGLIIVVGDNGTIIYSEDGIYWQKIELTVNSDIKNITTSPTKTKFLAVGESGVILTSQNGLTWRIFRTGRNDNLNSVYYSEIYSQFIAVGSNGAIESSVDGQIWKGYISGTNQNYESIIFSNELEKYIAVGSRGVVMTSYISSTENLISMMSPNSDINFNLAVGENVLRASCQNGNPRVTIEFKNKYIGV